MKLIKPGESLSPWSVVACPHLIAHIKSASCCRPNPRPSEIHMDCVPDVAVFKAINFQESHICVVIPLLSQLFSGGDRGMSH